MLHRINGATGVHLSLSECVTCDLLYSGRMQNILLLWQQRQHLLFIQKTCRHCLCPFNRVTCSRLMYRVAVSDANFSSESVSASIQPNPVIFTEASDVSREKIPWLWDVNDELTTEMCLLRSNERMSYMRTNGFSLGEPYEWTWIIHLATLCLFDNEIFSIHAVKCWTECVSHSSVMSLIICRLSSTSRGFVPHFEHLIS